MTTLFPDLRTHDVIARASSHYTPNYRQAPIVMTRGEGPWLWDRDDKRYLDMIAGIAVCSLGHCHPRLVAAIRDQSETLIHISNLFHNEPAVALMDALVTHSFADRVFFTNSGTEANEAALKLARRYRSVVCGQPERSEVLAFTSSFHGRSFGSLSATGQPKYHKGFEPLLPGFHYATFNDLDSVIALMDAAQGRIGSVIVEPIQCEGGINEPSDSFLTDLAKLCKERECTLIFDEVQTGVGRTGEWFCYEHFDVRPDIMTLAKGIASGVPLGAMVCTEELAQAFIPGTHASTFGANPLATRAGLEVFKTIEEESLLDHVYEVGNYLAKGLNALVKSYECCVQVRGRGLLRGLELVADERELGKSVVAKCRERGLLLNAIQGRVLRFAPPLTIGKGHVDTALEILGEVLAEFK